MERPVGALSIDDLKAFIAQAKQTGTSIPVWRVQRQLLKRVICPNSFLDADGLHYKSSEDYPHANRIYNISDGVYDSAYSGAFLFSNYWYAFAYLQKLKSQGGSTCQNQTVL